MGPTGFMAKLVSRRSLANFGFKGFGDQLWFGTHLALGARWLPPLAPFGLIGLGQKGPNWPADCGPWAVRAAGGLNGPKDHLGQNPTDERGWLGGLEAPRRQKDPQAQNQR
ncbi:hypothetical protein O181_106621 [Austropuccinia psidii MF-1]|uniref:Uncharacterized protein n=1 Tax=Austropuccinia psidii MF-1 TaxID=1389203 RepID=A0A9Q3JRS6_9BASI|nr:hypothetical protein [Austropuccinia psidii MF-1]